MSADPVLDGTSPPNRFACVRDNPESLRDPSGHDGGFFGSVLSAVSSAAQAKVAAVVLLRPRGTVA